MKPKSLSEMMQLLLLFFLYVITARLGLKMDAVNGFATLVWPPTGIALAALLLFGARLWPAIFFAALFVNYIIGAPPLAALGIAFGSTLEALIANHMMRRKGFSPELTKLQDAVLLVIYGAVLSTAFGATIGTLSLWATGALSASLVGSTWLAWWTGDAVGALIVAPLLLVWNVKKTRDQVDVSFCLVSHRRFLRQHLCHFLFFPSLFGRPCASV